MSNNHIHSLCYILNLESAFPELCCHIYCYRYSDRFKYRMSPTTTILLNNHVCNNLIIISSTRCLVSTSEELHPQGTKSANGEGWTMLQQSCTGRMRKHLWILDVSITHPNALSNMATPVEWLLLRREAEEKTKYGSWVTNTERASFEPLVIRTAATCSRFHKR